MRWKLLVLAMLMAGWATACATYEERQEAVVVKARAYALSQFPELTEKQRHQVDFTKPRLLQRRVLIQGGGEEFESERDLMQTCVVWSLPETGGQSLLVVGVGERKFAEWQPVRALIRNYAGVEEEFTEAP